MNIFFYRLSRGRRLIENTFGIAAAKWRLLLKSIELDINNATLAVQAIVCLHNFIVEEDGGVDYLADTDEREGAWRADVQNPLESIAIEGQIRGHRTANADFIRQSSVAYFNGEGAVDFQNDMVSCGNF